MIFGRFERRLSWVAHRILEAGVPVCDLQDEHVGDTSIEGKLKKLVAHAKEVQLAEKPAQ